MRSVVALALLASAGCGIVSGLDGLTTSDALTEAGGDADAAADTGAGDGPMASDVPVDAPSAACPFDASVEGCFGIACTSGTCCVRPTSVECGSTCSGASFACTSPTQCTATTAGTVCCLATTGAFDVSMCPVTVPITGTSATCVPTDECVTMTPSGHRLCRNDADCTVPSHCTEVEIGAAGAFVGVCL
jgi:hypothetical protein